MRSFILSFVLVVGFTCGQLIHDKTEIQSRCRFLYNDLFNEAEVKMMKCFRDNEVPEIEARQVLGFPLIRIAQGDHSDKQPQVYKCFNEEMNLSSGGFVNTRFFTDVMSKLGSDRPDEEIRLNMQQKSAECSSKELPWSCFWESCYLSPEDSSGPWRKQEVSNF